MAQITIEPRPRRHALPFVLGLLLLAVIAFAVWYFMQRSAGDDAELLAPPPAVSGDTAGGL